MQIRNLKVQCINNKKKNNTIKSKSELNFSNVPQQITILEMNFIFCGFHRSQGVYSCENTHKLSKRQKTLC